MSTTTKTVLVILVIAAIVILAMALLGSGSASAPESSQNPALLPTASTDASDAALQQDSAAIDTQLTGLDTDTQTVDEGMSEAQ